MPAAPLSDGTVTLRAWRPEDADWYAEQTRDADILRFTTEPPDLDPQAVREAIEQLAGAATQASFVMTDAGSGALLGNIGLAAEDAGTASLSYWVAAAARGRGVASRSVRLVVEWAWQLGFDRIELYTHVENTASQRVAEHAGFRFDRTEPAARTVRGHRWDVAWYAIDRPTAPAARP